MTMFHTYRRVLEMLAPEKTLVITLAVANVALAMIGLAEPVLFGRVVDALASGVSALPTIMLWGLLGLFGIVANAWVALHADRMAHRRRLAVIADFFEHTLALPIAFHGDTHSGRLSRIMVSGAGYMFGLWLSFLREHLASFVGIIILVPTALAIDWRMALLLGLLSAVFTGLYYFVLTRTGDLQQSVERYHSDVAQRTSDVMGNVLVVQSFTRARAEVMGLRQAMDALYMAQAPVLTWWALLSVLTRAASTLTMIAIFAVGALLHGRGETTVGAVVSFVGFAGLMIGKLERLASFVSQLFFHAHGLAEYFEVLDERASVADLPDATPLALVKGAVAFNSVSFGYPGSSRGVADLTFSAQPGQTIALVGPTGAGKSTALALLYRARDPAAGTITIDGQDIRTVTLNSLRASIAVVFQDGGLFNRSIADNLRIGKQDATMDEIVAAAKLAEAHEFIIQKPDGYETVLGERGSNLSGGERQRLSIARALLKNAPILILDEATSALDTETEAHVQRALARLRVGRTTFVIAHRLSTIRDADLILVMDQGRIAETGQFKQLSAGHGLFARLARQSGFAADVSA